ncbi:DUF4823 domain-containing protein [Aestuariirhabdus sp. Z084]|uniref:DUF4823 domain-containing protein n=1 Tax=Aestuariirhabdus haliotis TaxID=2918751 RepID=UPI00201B3967|nr:DUF4823 domain-containing protein [Aestuariirhabdus haliotis]MCL6414847.1 DUF4823 domain-containing protein [Aestuariirhabdus haliotis]MCL6418779.1 DUF4823 domain-containing protein [Aestuariirhabdus haliotis]
MKLFFKLGGLLLFMAVSGCMPSDIYSETERYARDARLLDSFDLHRTANWSLVNDPSISIVTIKQAQAEANRYNQSLASTVAGVFRAYFPHIHTAKQAKNLNAALSIARRERADYLLMPQVLVYNDAIGTWAEWRESQEMSKVGRDKIKITLSLYNSGTGDLVENAYIEGRSGWLTFINSDPSELLGPAVDKYAHQLYGKD